MRDLSRWRDGEGRKLGHGFSQEEFTAIRGGDANRKKLSKLCRKTNSAAFHFIAVLFNFLSNLASSILEIREWKEKCLFFFFFFFFSFSFLFLFQARFYVYKICRKDFAKGFFFFWGGGEARTGGEKKRVTNVGHERGAESLPAATRLSRRSSSPKLMASHFSAPRYASFNQPER